MVKLSSRKQVDEKVHVNHCDGRLAKKSNEEEDFTSHCVYTFLLIKLETSLCREEEKMDKYCDSEKPSIYWVHLLNYECKKCKKTFQNYIPYYGDGVVDFENQATHKIKWLPEYGRGGFLDLFNKLNPNFSGELIPKVEDTFIAELNKFIEKDDNEYFVLNSRKHQCTYCQSKDIKEINEEVLTNPNLDWLRISCELIESKSH